MSEKIVIGMCPKCSGENIVEVNEGQVHYPVLSWDEDGFPEEYGMDYLQRDTLDVCTGERYLCRDCDLRFAHPRLDVVEQPSLSNVPVQGVCPFCCSGDLEGIYQVSVAFPIVSFISSGEARLNLRDHKIVTDVADIDRPPRFHCLTCNKTFDRPLITPKERIKEYA